MVRRAPLATVVAVTLALALAGGCTRSNDLYCCTDPVLCGGGFDDCRAGLICDDRGLEGPANTCVNDPAAVTCAGPQDCAAPTPACVDRVCVPCATDADCPDSAMAQCDRDTNRCVRCDDGGQCSRFGSDTCSEEGVCVECEATAAPVESAECDASEPICVAPGSCRGCTDHRQCSSGACDLGSGACVGADDIAYVDGQPGGGTDCTFVAPCERITDGLATGKSYVVISAGSYQEDLAVTERTVSLVGYGATVTALTNSVVALAVGGSAGTVSLFGLTLTGSTKGAECDGSTGATLALSLIDVTVSDNAQAGITAADCDLTIRRGRISGNDGGGVDLDNAGFDIVNTVIDGNGDTGPYGGVQISDPRPSPARIAFTTIVGNRSSTGGDQAVPGIRCESLAATVTLHSTIVTDNNGGTSAVQVSGHPGCSYQRSLINPLAEGADNLTGAPGFVDAAFHLGADSPARDVGRPDTGILDDIDGEVRPADLPDIGADEYLAP